MSEERKVGYMFIITVLILALGFSFGAIANQRTRLVTQQELITFIKFESDASHEITLEMIDLVAACYADDGDGLSPKK